MLTIAVTAVAGTVLFSASQAGGDALLRAIAPCAMLVAATWAAYWRPQITVDADSVSVRNVFSTDHVKLEDVQRIDTRYALMLETTRGKVTAWAAPAPGRHSVVLAKREDWAGAADAFDRAAELNPSMAYAHYYGGLMAYRAGRPARMANPFERFLQLAPEAPEWPEVMSIMRTVRGR